MKGADVPPVDLAVVGAGPAGLGAAVEAARLGLSVRVIDEYPCAGGRLLGQLHRRGGAWQVGRVRAAWLEAQARAAGEVALQLGTGVWALDREGEGDLPWRLFASDRSEPVRARAVVVATGAAEVPLPLPGWTLPGVLAVGAAQTLANVWGVAPGRRGLIVGLSPLAFAIAQELAWAGAAPAAIVPAVGGPGRSHVGDPEAQWQALLRLRAMAPWWARPGAALLAAGGPRRALMPRLPVGGIPLFGTRLRLNVAAEAILAERDGEGVAAVRLRRLDGRGEPVGTAFVQAADCVLLAGGLRPIPDLIVGAGARTAVVAALGGEVAIVDADGETTAPGLFAAGNTLGVEGSAVAEAQGRRAGLAVAARLGRGVPAVCLAAARRAVARARAEAPFAFQPDVAGGHDEVAARWRARADRAPPASGREGPG